MSLNFENAHFVQSATDYRQLPSDQGGEVAFLGRSNAGKSSAINRLTRKGLARTSKTPGRTQHINVFSLTPKTNTSTDDDRCHHRLIDLPGYGFAKAPQAVRKQWPHMINDYLTRRLSLKGLILIVDSRHPPKPSDKQVLTWCKKANLPVHILATKADKLSRNAAAQALSALSKTLNCTALNAHNPLPSIQDTHTVQLFSAQTGQGLDAARASIKRWLEQAN